MEQLPDKVIDIEILRINRNMQKHCKCECKTFTVDTKNRSVYCGKCGAWVDPYDAMVYLAENPEEYQYEVNCLLNQAKEIQRYHPHLKIFKSMESSYRTGMAPECPKCKRLFDFKDITGWGNKSYLEDK